jgi:hypothetical protein
MGYEEKTKLINGVELPRVTYVLKTVSTGEVLINWVKKLIKDYIFEFVSKGGVISNSNLTNILETIGELNNKALKEAGFIGTDFHNIAENIGKGIALPEIKEPRVKEWVDLFNTWLGENVKRFIETEKDVYTDRYCGTLDALVELKDGRIALLDYKTSKYIYDTHHLQVAAYVKAYEQMNKIKIDTAFILRFEKGDKKKLFEVKEIGEIDYQAEIFNKVLDIWNWQKGKK